MIKRREKFAIALIAATAVVAWTPDLGAQAVAAAPIERPNVIIIFTDDQGWADVGCYGATHLKTPHLDRMAAEGVKFTDFYVAQAVCSASRAALLTGCYPNRIGVLYALFPNVPTGIHDKEMTLAELLKQRDYATAIYGKWHLGSQEKFLPQRHGFDDYFGLPYSNDMWPLHPTDKSHPPLPLYDGSKVIATNPDQTKLTTWYTERAVKFIAANKDRPFFLYVPHSMPHVPLFVSDRYKQSSAQGLYGDVIQEIDWSVGQIIEALKEHGLDERTLVIFTSDNGPWLSYGNHGGSAGPLREGKASTWEGGMRVPCIMRWPGQIPPATVCHEVAATIDILPTVARLADAPLPPRTIDGRDIWPLISGDPQASSPHEAYYFYWGRSLEAVRSGRSKLVFPHVYGSIGERPGRDGIPGGVTRGETDLALFDLQTDPGERYNLLDQHPNVVKRLEALAEKARADLGDSATERKGTGVREPGRI